MSTNVDNVTNITVDNVTNITEKASIKKKKKPKISEAEKNRLMILETANLKKRLMKEELILELEMTKKSMKHGRLEWEKICKDIKIKEFHKELQEWSKKTERILEKKDEKVEMLIKNIEETQEMHKRIVLQHRDQLEHLINCHQTLRETASELYNSQASDLIQHFFDERRSIQEVQEKNKLNNENILRTTNLAFKKRLRESYELRMKRKFEVSSEIYRRHVCRDRTVKKMNYLQEQLLNFVDEQEVDLIDVHKIKNYLNFIQMEQDYVIETKELNEIERMNETTVSELQQELLHIETTGNKKILKLELERNDLLNLRASIRRSTDRDKLLIQEKILKVSSESYEEMKKMKEFIKHGELLLRLVALCRKYETEKEKVIPFQNSNEDSDTEDQLKLNVMDIAKLMDITEEEVLDQMNHFRNFWRRCSDVSYHNLLLKKEKLKLTEENEKYRNIIRSMDKTGVEAILECLKIRQI